MVKKNQLKKLDDNEVKKLDSGQKDFYVEKIEIEEINYDLDSDPELEENSELIKYEFNMIELPFFTKDKTIEDNKARKYTFSEKDNSYMQIVPSGDPGLISNKIPQEFDEKVFYGILKLSKEQNSREVITDYFTLAKVSEVPYKNLERLKDSLQRLRRTTIEMNNIFYDAFIKKKTDGNQDFNILQNKEEYTFKEVQKFPDDLKWKYQKYFRNSKISEILVLTLADKIYKNIEHKGFLYFNQKELLGIDNATARKLFILIKKWHGWQKKSVIRRSCRFLSSRIPLSWEKKTISSSINTLESACKMLKDKNLILNFALLKTSPVKNSYIEFHFSEESSKLIDYNMKAASVTTGHEEMIIDEIEDEFLDDRQTSIFEIDNKTEFDVLFSTLPEQSRTESNKRILIEHNSKGIEYLRSSIEYAKKNYKDNFDAYLRMTLESDWSKGDREKAAIIKKKTEKEKEKEKTKNEDLRKSAEKKYNSMTPEEMESLYHETRDSMYFKMVLQKKIDKGEMTEEEALKEAALLVIIGKK